MHVVKFADYSRRTGDLSSPASPVVKIENSLEYVLRRFLLL